MSFKVNVTRFQPVNNAGALKAFFTAELEGGVRVVDCRMLTQADGTLFVTGPQKEYTTAEGERKFKQLVTFSRELSEAIAEAAWLACEAHSNKQ